MNRSIKIFEKRLKKTDIHKRFAFPSSSLWSLPPFQEHHAVEVEVWDVGMNRVWKLMCLIRKKGYRKPVFSKGWCKFVKDNGLVVGDKLRFFKVEDRYEIEVERATVQAAETTNKRNKTSEDNRPTGFYETTASALFELDTTLKL